MPFLHKKFLLLRKSFSVHKLFEQSSSFERVISQIQLKIIAKNDYKFLFDLLKERNPKNNISHTKMPTFRQHQKFIESKPYSKWYIILYKNQKIGSAYLSKQNEIGINILKTFSKNFVYSESLKILIDKNPKKKYFANISPKNLQLQTFFKKHGFKLLQQTYAFENNDLK